MPHAVIRTPPRDGALLAECAALKQALERHPTLRSLWTSAEWPDLERRLGALLTTVHRYRPASDPGPPRDPGQVRAVHWNIEHGNWYPRVESALLAHPDLREADVLFFNEIDLGMARAGNRDVAGDLCASLQRHGVYLPLFLETTIGRDDDASTAGGQPNQESLFGIAILSRWPIGEVRAVDLPSPVRHQFEGERMYGRHAALVAEILRPGAPFVAVAAHLEVHRTRAERDQQVRTALAALNGERRPILFAGDFNTHTFDRGRPWDPLFGAAVLMLAPSAVLNRRLLFPDRGPARERLFDALAGAGFTWEPLVDRAPTLALRFDRLEEVEILFGPLAPAARRALRWAERRGRLRLDWFAARGWSGGRGHTVTGLDGAGQASDHAPIVAELW